MIIEWLPVARADLLEIFDYILEDNPRAAGTVLDRIEEAVEQLAEHPGIGRPGRVEHTRELVIAGLPYIVPYVARHDRIYVLRVLHGSMKWPDRL